MEPKSTGPSPFKRTWYVIYTRPRWEKKVDASLSQAGITSYCPLKTVKNQWADRQKSVSLPLFTSYVFVYIDLREELTVKQTPGVVNFVYFMGKLATIKDQVIEDIKSALARYPDAEVINARHLDIGTRVRIKEGLMEEKEGFVKKMLSHHILVAIESLSCILVTQVPIGALEVIR